eukprot:g2118.t1
MASGSRALHARLVSKNPQDVIDGLRACNENVGILNKTLILRDVIGTLHGGTCDQYTEAQQLALGVLARFLRATKTSDHKHALLVLKEGAKKATKWSGCSSFLPYLRGSPEDETVLTDAWSCFHTIVTAAMDPVAAKTRSQNVKQIIKGGEPLVAIAAVLHEIILESESISKEEKSEDSKTKEVTEESVLRYTVDIFRLLCNDSINTMLFNQCAQDFLKDSKGAHVLAKFINYNRNEETYIDIVARFSDLAQVRRRLYEGGALKECADLLCRSPPRGGSEMRWACKILQDILYDQEMIKGVESAENDDSFDDQLSFVASSMCKTLESLIEVRCEDEKEKEEDDDDDEVNGKTVNTKDDDDDANNGKSVLRIICETMLRMCQRKQASLLASKTEPAADEKKCEDCADADDASSARSICNVAELSRRAFQQHSALSIIVRMLCVSVSSPSDRITLEDLARELASSTDDAQVVDASGDQTIALIVDGLRSNHKDNMPHIARVLEILFANPKNVSAFCGADLRGPSALVECVKRDNERGATNEATETDRQLLLTLLRAMLCVVRHISRSRESFHASAQDLVSTLLGVCRRRETDDDASSLALQIMIAMLESRSDFAEDEAGDDPFLEVDRATYTRLSDFYELLSPETGAFGCTKMTSMLLSVIRRFVERNADDTMRHLLECLSGEASYPPSSREECWPYDPDTPPSVLTLESSNIEGRLLRPLLARLLHADAASRSEVDAVVFMLRRMCVPENSSPDSTKTEEEEEKEEANDTRPCLKDILMQAATIRGVVGLLVSALPVASPSAALAIRETLESIILYASRNNEAYETLLASYNETVASYADGSDEEDEAKKDDDDDESDGTTTKKPAMPIAIDTWAALLSAAHATGSYGDSSPLHVAIMLERADVVQLLLRARAHLDCRDDDDFTPLMRALAVGSVECIDTVLSHARNPSNGVDIEILDTTTAAGLPALKIAFLSPDPTVLRSAMARDPHDPHPLRFSTDSRAFDNVEKMLQSRADLSVVDAEGCGPLHWTIGNSFAFSQTLARRQVHVSIRDTKIVPSEILRRVKRMIELGVDVNVRNTFGESALHFAAKRGLTDVCSELLSSGAVANVLNVRGESPLHMLCSSDGVNVSAIREFVSAALTYPLATSAPVSRGHVDILHSRRARLLKRIESAMNACYEEVTRPPCVAKKCASVEDVLLQKDLDQLTTLHRIVGAKRNCGMRSDSSRIDTLRNRLEVCAYILKSMPSDVSRTKAVEPDASGRSPLHHAAIYLSSADVRANEGHVHLAKQIVEALIECGNRVYDADHANDDDSDVRKTALHYALENENFDLAAYLVEKGRAEGENSTRLSPSAFLVAASKPSVPIPLFESIYNSASTNPPNDSNKMQASSDVVALHIAASAGNVAVLQFLIDRGVSVDAPSEHNESTALFLSASNAPHELCLRAVQILEKGGADPKKLNCNGEHALFAAVRGDRAELATYLISRIDSASVIAPNANGATVRDVCEAMRDDLSDETVAIIRKHCKTPKEIEAIERRRKEDEERRRAAIKIENMFRRKSAIRMADMRRNSLANKNAAGS